MSRDLDTTSVYLTAGGYHENSIVGAELPPKPESTITMRLSRRVRALVVGAALLASVSACGPGPTSQQQSGEAVVETWQEAKAKTQAMELEIANLIPAEIRTGIEQIPAGSMYPCKNKQHRWGGWTRVTVVPGTDINEITRNIETYYQDSKYVTENWIIGLDDYFVQLIASDRAETYLFGADFNPDAFRIDSYSACVTLPEGTWPRGHF